MTISDAFAAPVAAAAAAGSPEAAPTKARVHARMRARGYRSLPVVGKIGGLASTVGTDLRSAWWTPTSLPTVQRAWAQRLPDRDRVPGSNAALYMAWLVYNHTLGLAAPAVAVAVVAVVSTVAWMFAHPARALLLAALIAVTAAIFAI